jgi:4-amino-4-deoxy-L-arabinose transferase-like glycosyltransferase
MLHRHDYVTPYIDGIRFFDKPPLMYWLAAGSMKIFGEHAWAARLPLALSVLALLLSVYWLGLRLLVLVSPAASHADRGALYSALAMATAIGTYLYTRFFIPDILIGLWLTLGIHLFLIACDRASIRLQEHARLQEHRQLAPNASSSALLPSLGFGVVLGLNLLTKGLIGLVFPLFFVLLYLVLTRQLRLWRYLSILPAGIAFAVVGLPWHILAALRNPPVSMPTGVGLPAHAGWAWFYLYNEHVARFLGRRIPHDYGNTPVWVFWLYAAVWIMPWAAFLPGAFLVLKRQLGHRFPVKMRDREAALTLTLWAAIVMVFFTLSSRQEYYSLPALPAFALMAGGLLARADHDATFRARLNGEENAFRIALNCHRWILLPLAALTAAVCIFFAVEAPPTPHGADLSALLASNPALYNLSLGHLFDLTGAAMDLFRGPLLLVAAGMLTLGVVSFLLRSKNHTYAANLTLAGGMIAVLLAAHSGLERFYPVLGSEALAESILQMQRQSPTSPASPQDEILLDGELTSGSSLLFYTRQPLHLVDGRKNGPWFGSFYPDAPAIFESEESLRTLWNGPHRIFLLTYDPAARIHELSAFAPVHEIASRGGKTILTNR